MLIASSLGAASCARKRNFQRCANWPESDVSCVNAKPSSLPPPTKRIRRIGPKDHVIRRKSSSRYHCTQAPVYPRRNLFAGEPVISSRAIINSTRNSIAPFQKPGMGPRPLKSFAIASFRTQIRPNLILPFASFVHLDAPGRTKNSQPTSTKDIPYRLRVFGLYWEKP